MSGRGLPGPLPQGETVLWSGAPEWRVLARTALHVRKLAVYFALIAVYAGVSSWVAGAGLEAAALTLLETAGIGAIPVALALLYAWGVGRVAVYTITNRRVVLHIGLALPVTLNLPFARIVSADMNASADGSGEISFALAGQDRFGYAILWPHARPWHFAKAQPAMRGLSDVALPAKVLADALAGSTVVHVVELAEFPAGASLAA